jgi:hypothetical protein
MRGAAGLDVERRAGWQCVGSGLSWANDRGEAREEHQRSERAVAGRKHILNAHLRVRRPLRRCVDRG